MLTIKDLHARVTGEQKEILCGVSLAVPPDKIVALMGPNGSGKSTLSHVLMGSPDYEVISGSARLGNKDLLALDPWERARAGLFLAFQYPYEIPGLSVYHFLQTAVRSVRGERYDEKKFSRELKAALHDLRLASDFLDRGLNEGFSGGEKKRMEILQLRLLQPRIAILDETDSGLDIDALRLVAENVKRLVGPRLGVLVITHYQRLLNYLKPDEVHVLSQGQIVKSGSYRLVKQLEERGYDWLIKKN